MTINLKGKISVIAGTLLLITLAACDFGSTMYHSYNPIPEQGWAKSDTLLFHVNIPDSLTPYKVSVEIRNDNNYPYKNLYLFVSNNTKDSTIFATDTIKYVVAEESGKWIGTGFGTLYQSGQPLGKFIPLHPGKYIFKVVHGMKDQFLQGISDVGLRIEH